jgi:hypothetical protein
MPTCPKPRKTKTAFVTFKTDHKPKSKMSLLERRAKPTLTVKVDGLKDRCMRWSVQSIRTLRGSIMSGDRRARTLLQTVKAKACRIITGVLGAFALA